MKIPAGLIFVAALVVAATAAATPPRSGIAASQCAQQGTGYYCWFHSANFNLECELDVEKVGSKSYDYCQTVKPKPASVKMNESGKLKICNGGQCIGDGPENSKTLAVGHSMRLGPFSCSASATAFRCTVASGKGFSIGSKITGIS